MSNDDADGRRARMTAHIGYALICALLDELEMDAPGLSKRVWKSAHRSLKEYDLLDPDSADWMSAKIAQL